MPRPHDPQSTTHISHRSLRRGEGARPEESNGTAAVNTFFAERPRGVSCRGPAA